MSKNQKSTVVAVFESVKQANSAIEDLLDAGFPKKSIGFLTHDEGETDEKAKTEAAGDATAVRSATGGVAGGLLGGILGSLSALVLPGVGPVILVGLFAAAGGAIAGTFTGLMSSVGLADDDIAWFLGEFKSGRHIVVVEVDGRYSEALAIMQSHGGYDMVRQRETSSSSPHK